MCMFSVLKVPSILLPACLEIGIKPASQPMHLSPVMSIEFLNMVIPEATKANLAKTRNTLNISEALDAQEYAAIHR